MSKITHILLSLSSPSQKVISQLETLFTNFLWGNKPLKFRKEILEANTVDGGLKLHNLRYFDAALKIGWLKRYLQTNSKWKSVTNAFKFSGLFICGRDFIERMIDITFNPFWQNVLTSLDLLWS